MEIVGAVVFSLIALAGCAVFVVFIAMVLFAKTSGLLRLSERYPSHSQPEGLGSTRQTVQIGPVRYRRCTTVIIGPSGLYLWPRPVLSRHQPVLIPWEEITQVEETRLYWQEAVRLTVGTSPATSVTVYNQLYEAMRAYLPAGRRPK